MTDGATPTLSELWASADETSGELYEYPDWYISLSRIGGRVTPEDIARWPKLRKPIMLEDVLHWSRLEGEERASAIAEFTVAPRADHRRTSCALPLSGASLHASEAGGT